ncbi:CcdB family protein [Sphingomonas sp. IC4-52]|uniref:CcdB family protein n=1 Tax=Sphingomonas sp. IC4-52 TaxID=2887202 RepID=UPI001D11599B|nr:CcdB family protein [Sphingomonas sp. IC4-52]MCC2980596.1 CcdB family protein [Sphingomonas sp. IC4-52]
MAMFDLYRLSDGALAADFQAKFFSDIGTRFVIPLLPRGTGAPPSPRINPEVDVNGETLVFATLLAGTIRTAELRRRVTTLFRDHLLITGAVDVVIGTA